jgi:cytochrome c-type biogenesis protein CcmF
VGQPYFDTMSAPIGLALLFLMGVGPGLPWGRTEGSIPALFWKQASFSALVAVLSFALGVRSPWVAGTFAFATFAAWASLREIWAPAKVRMANQGESLGVALFTAIRRSRRRFGGHVVHLGVVVLAVAMASAAHWRQDMDVTLSKGEATEVMGYSLTYLGSETQDQPHRVSQVGRFAVSRRGTDLGILEPRFNRYKSRGDEIPSPAVHSGPREDLYLSLLRVDEDDTASLRVVIQPLVAWLWIGGLMMVLGSAIAAFPEGLLRRLGARTSEEAA